MSLPAWPSDVNSNVVRGTWQVPQRSNPPLVSEMNSGTTRRRAKYTLRVATMAFGLILSADEQTSFHFFYDVTLGEGSSRFTMLVWDGANYRTQTVQIKSSKEAEWAYQRIMLSLEVLVENLGAGPLYVPATPAPVGALLLPDNSSALLLPDGSSVFLRP